MAGVLGFEPRMPIPKTGALPLGDTPTTLDTNISNNLFSRRVNKVVLNNFQPIL